MICHCYDHTVNFFLTLAFFNSVWGTDHTLKRRKQKKGPILPSSGAIGASAVTCWQLLATCQLFSRSQWHLELIVLSREDCVPHDWIFQNQLHSPQFSSSLPSEQSLVLSQRQDWEMHRPSPHWNWKGPHEPDTWPGGLRRAQGDSSRPSLQSTRPSHSLFLGRQTSVGPQEKPSQCWQEASSLPSPQWSSPSQSKSRAKQRALLQVNSSSLHRRGPVERDSTQQVSSLRSDLSDLSSPLARFHTKRKQRQKQRSSQHWCFDSSSYLLHLPWLFLLFASVLFLFFLIDYHKVNFFYIQQSVSGNK